MPTALSHSLRALAILREQAPGFCRAASRDLPAMLLVEGLPGPHPAPDSEPAEPHDDPLRSPATFGSLDDLTAWWVDTHPDRKGTGLYLTPSSAARALLNQSTRDGWRPLSVIDPAVGAGVFLLEARSLFGQGVALHGIDSDPMAVATSRLALWLAGETEDPVLLADRIRWGDALSGEPEGQGQFDLVCGNPPFGNAIERRTALEPDRRLFMSGRFADVVKGPYDRSVLFVRLAGGLLSRGGRIALLVPRALLAARYAEKLRAWLEREAPLADLVRFPADAPCPDAAIAMVGWIARRGAGSREVRVVAPSGTERIPGSGAPSAGSEDRRIPARLLSPSSWGVLIDPLAERIERIARTHPLLAEVARVRAGASVSEAYRMAGEVVDGGAGWKLLTSGLIMRYEDQWGRRRALHLGRSFSEPVLPHASGSVRPARRDLYNSPKIIVCGLSRVLRARIDETGEFAGSVGSFLILPRGAEDVDPRWLSRLAILLNSAWYTMVHRVRRGALALSGGNLPLGRRDIEEFPLPSAFVGDADPALPRNRTDLLALLDGLDPFSDDLRLQRVILALAGYDEDDAEAIIDAWSQLMTTSGRPRNAR